MMYITRELMIQCSYQVVLFIYLFRFTIAKLQRWHKMRYDYAS